jgi:poly(3-hydroxybutyrate) depolymerase
MRCNRSVRRSLLFAMAGLVGALTAISAQAASLQQVNANWAGGVSGLPSDVTTFVYVPNNVATNPPILTLIHYCGGTASTDSSGGMMTELLLALYPDIFEAGASFAACRPDAAERMSQAPRWGTAARAQAGR